MGKGLIFFCCACAILVFTIINLSVGPAISGKIGNWGTANCASFKDLYDLAKDSGAKGDDLKYGAEFWLNYCNNHKGMYNMEYTSFIFDIVIGFVCGLLGLLHIFEVKKDLISKTGLVGLGCGIVGFVFTFVYVILNGIVMTTTYYGTVTYVDDLENPTTLPYEGITKRDSDGVFAEKDGNTFKCIYYDSEVNYHALYATYGDLIGKQYNYNKDLREKIKKAIASGCVSSALNCNDGIINAPATCDKIYAGYIDTITNKDRADRFLTTLLLSLFVCLANIGLALFGFLLFRTPSDF
jgi:hypothetical protein